MSKLQINRYVVALNNDTLVDIVPLRYEISHLPWLRASGKS